MTRLSFIQKIALPVTLTMAGYVTAGAPPPGNEQYGYSTQTVIGDSVLEGSRGVVGVNMAAGDSNVQLNAKALAVGVGQGASAIARVRTSQHVDYSGYGPDSAVTSIDGTAFSNSAGMISINQVSGVGNAQTNDVAIAFALGGVAVAESELGLTVTGQPISPLAEHEALQHREVSISGTAFTSTSGLVQINQLAGSGNATANSFDLSVSLGADE